MARWTTFPSWTTGFTVPRPMPSIATSGMFMIGVKCPLPIPPWLEIVNVPPCISSSGTLRARVRSAISCSSTESWNTLFLSTSRITGTIKPLFGVDGDADVEVVLEDDLAPGFVDARIEDGCFFSASTTAFSSERRQRQVRVLLFVSRLVLLPAARAGPVTSTSSNWVTCGIAVHDSTILRLIVLRGVVIFSARTGPHCEKSTGWGAGFAAGDGAPAGRAFAGAPGPRPVAGDAGCSGGCPT